MQQSFIPDSSVKLLIDTNIILDLALKRGVLGHDAALLLDAIAKGRADGFISSHCVTTVYYVIAKKQDAATARMAVTDLLRIGSVVPLGDNDFHAAIAMKLTDFEDAVQAAAALAIGADYLVTGNTKHFKGAPVKPRTAAEVLPLLPVA